MTLDQQEWALIGDLAEVAGSSDRGSFLDQLRERLGHQPGRSRALIGLIQELIAIDLDLADVAPSVAALLRSRVAADAVADAFRPATADDLEDAYGPDDIFRIARVRGQAEAAVLAEEMLDSGSVATLLGSRSRNPREYARQLRARRDVLALRVGNRFVFPAFQFDEGRRELRPLVAEINRVLDASEDPWGVSSFWFTTDPYARARPADLAASGRAQELRAAAQRELAPVG
jgi:hypothetical protein